MDRNETLRRHIKADGLGIEVAPYFTPIMPKRAGYNCLSLDVFDTATLIDKAKIDPNIPDSQVADIEEVDLVGSATEIEALVNARNQLGHFDYIISSHNFEHLPNPIKFLQGCGKVLKPGGVLTMAIPDRRACFDYFRPYTTLGEWIEAFKENRTQPTNAQTFDWLQLFSNLHVDNNKVGAFGLSDDRAKIQVEDSLLAAFGSWNERERAGDTSYQDTHCSVFTRWSFILLINDCYFLGLSPFSCEEVSELYGCEFHAHLKNVGYLKPEDRNTERFYAFRQMALQKIMKETA